MRIQTDATDTFWIQIPAKDPNVSFLSAKLLPSCMFSPELPLLAGNSIDHATEGWQLNKGFQLPSELYTDPLLASNHELCLINDENLIFMRL